MNKLGVHALVWTGGWNPREAALAVERTAELGYDLIEIPALDPAAIDVTLTRRLVEASGLGITVSLGLDGEADISSEDADKVTRGEKVLNDALAVTRDIGGTHMCGILYSGFQKYAVPATPRGVENSVDVLRRIAGRAAASSITIGLEVVNRYESNVLNTARQAVDFCRRIDAPNVKVHLDTYHMNIEENDIEQAILTAGADLGYFHIGESNRGYLGAGNIDFDKVFRGLARLDYRGPITFESFSSTVVDPRLSGILAIWRNLWEDSRDLAGHARDFIRANLKAAREAQLRQ
ncbi:D-psicose/D-tagatose/L-ribulose 3-epimerase [Dongia mobilis]|uniref:D-psicose/D-tagatose/L-ribulose 3-epimerase n=1 Tax=Dongia mobilis TaxID=578943 RepID=A0A4R6WQ66_9PROT|nr:sugar phosphate isomerase/epimerase family protein [Dongia mobilis]TDQ83265.1 D-psicose/D-tagatose/L-ribulose 3-epimerase [Dongia mobilis]